MEASGDELGGRPGYGEGKAVTRAALYARVSTTGQTAENQLLALRAFTAARGWTAAEFVDHGVSGAKEKRPALEALLASVRARRVDVLVCVVNGKPKVLACGKGIVPTPGFTPRPRRAARGRP